MLIASWILGLGSWFVCLLFRQFVFVLGSRFLGSTLMGAWFMGSRLWDLGSRGLGTWVVQGVSKKLVHSARHFIGNFEGL